MRTSGRHEIVCGDCARKESLEQVPVAECAGAGAASLLKALTSGGCSHHNCQSHFVQMGCAGVVEDEDKNALKNEGDQ